MKILLQIATILFFAYLFYYIINHRKNVNAVLKPLLNDNSYLFRALIKYNTPQNTQSLNAALLVTDATITVIPMINNKQGEPISLSPQSLVIANPANNPKDDSGDLYFWLDAERTINNRYKFEDINQFTTDNNAKLRKHSQKESAIALYHLLTQLGSQIA